MLLGVTSLIYFFIEHKEPESILNRTKKLWQKNYTLGQ